MLVICTRKVMETQCLSSRWSRCSVSKTEVSLMYVAWLCLAWIWNVLSSTFSFLIDVRGIFEDGTECLLMELCLVPFFGSLHQFKLFFGYTHRHMKSPKERWIERPGSWNSYLDKYTENCNNGETFKTRKKNSIKLCMCIIRWELRAELSKLAVLHALARAFA